MKVMRLLFLFLQLLVIQDLYAQIPKTISFQGHVFTSTGDPVNGNTRITFTMYDSKQSQQYVHQETQDVDIVKGLYNVSLGKEKPILLPFDKQYFITVTIDGIESTERIPLQSTPYSFRSGGVTDTSVFADDMNSKGSKEGNALISLGGKVQWLPVIRKITTDGIIYVSTLNNTGEVQLLIPDGSIPGNKIWDYTLPYSKFLVNKAPKDKQVLSYDSVLNSLLWIDSPSASLSLPFEASVGSLKPLFNITNTRNATAGKFSIQTNPGTQHALIGENNGIGSAIAGFATGNGQAGYFSVKNAAGTASAMKVESNSKGHGIESSLSNGVANNTAAVFGVNASSADSSYGVIGSITSNAAGQLSAGVRGIMQSATPLGYGVLGSHAGLGSGVYGSSQLGVGITGLSTDSIGIIAVHADSTHSDPAFFAKSFSIADSASSILAQLVPQNAGQYSAAIVGKNSSLQSVSYGIWGQHTGNGAGIAGSSVNGIGVRGISQQSYGIIGQHTSNSGDEAGVQGISSSASSKASGVFGTISANTPGLQSAGVLGKITSTSAFGYGVYGVHEGAGSGVFGTSANGTGVEGFIASSSASGIAVKGTLDSKNGSAVYAQGTSASGLYYGLNAIVISDSAIAVRGKSTSTKQTSYAGLFEGKVNVTGDITKTYATGIPNGERRAMPIAYGSISMTGEILSGTPNFTCYWDGATKQYVVSIANQGYNSSTFVTTATAAGNGAPVIIMSSRLPNDLLSIKCYTLQGDLVQSDFHLMIYKP